MRPLIFIHILLVSISVLAQNPSKLEFGGYIKDVQTVFVPEPDSLPWFTDNTLENRLKLKYFATEWLTVNAEARNRFIYGDFVKIPGYAQNIKKHMGQLDLSISGDSRNSVVAHSELDRLNMDITLGKWQIIAGRQRVNWGQNLVWNPNDIVNTYNYFNFEYEERSGVDGITAKFYPSFSSVAEAVWVYHENPDSMISAGLYRFNRWGYDFQILGGMVQTDWALGTGWTGHISKASFRGEITLLAPRIENNQEEAVIGSLSGDYTFGALNNYVHAGILYNSTGKTNVGQSLNMFQETQVSPRSLSRGRVNLFGQYSVQPMPLISLGASAIVNPEDGSAFISPTATFSVANNFDFSAVAIFFLGNSGDEYGGVGQMGYLRFKYSF
jgi:hypothetical protein